MKRFFPCLLLTGLLLTGCGQKSNETNFVTATLGTVTETTAASPDESAGDDRAGDTAKQHAKTDASKQQTTHPTTVGGTTAQPADRTRTPQQQTDAPQQADTPGHAKTSDPGDIPRDGWVTDDSAKAPADIITEPREQDPPQPVITDVPVTTDDDGVIHLPIIEIS